MFCGIHFGSPIKSFAKELKQYSDKNKVVISFTTIGINGPELERWNQIWKEFGLEIYNFGKQSERKISETIQNSDFGLTTTPAILVEKSGSLAALQDHRIPVICVARP